MTADLAVPGMDRHDAALARGPRKSSRGRFRRALVDGLLITVVFFQATARSAESVVLENPHLLVAFSTRDGSMTRLRNKATKLELISLASELVQPWALMLAPSELVSDFNAFRILPPAADRANQVRLEWDTRFGITVRATARLEPGSDELELTAPPRIEAIARSSPCDTPRSRASVRFRATGDRTGFCTRP